MIWPCSHVAAMAAYALADLTVDSGVPLISLSQNESAFPPSPAAIGAAQAAMADAHLYPDPDWTELVAAIARVYRVPAGSILCGAGSMELIGALVRAFAGPGDQVLASAFSYAFFRTATLAAGADYVAANESDLTVSVDALLGAVTPRTRIVCVANPGNPTGTRIGRRDVVRLREGLPRNVILLLDEAYGEFADAPGEATFDLVGRGDTVVLRTFSKAYCLAGMRVGWGLFPPAIGGEVRKLLEPNNISAASQAAAVAAANDRAHMHAVVAETVARRARFTQSLHALGLDVSESHTNFVLIRFADASAVARADRVLRSEGIVMRGMAGYGLANALRATISTDDHTTLAANVLARWRRAEGNS
ncbi:MAG: aminotransferase class I/II-fold pyridoxal phosphate-dependent enzyme [Alphaproteobacteria bacterium]|nr:aminotransferase class I/II-fold pyridoxal phosphate-dependent enzyme [Alphaproteobacteria bacterium]